MLYFGIDWGQSEHTLCICNDAGATISQLRLAHSLAGFQQIEAERRKLGAAASTCLVAIETAHNLIVDYLAEHGYPVYIIPPQATDAYRHRQRLSGAHNDASDAALLANIVRTARACHRRWQPNSPLTQQMASLLRLVEGLRRTMQCQENQLRAALQRTYPVAIDLFSGLTTYIALQFLSHYPTLPEAQALSLEQFTSFCREQGYKQWSLIPKRYDQLLASRPTAQPAVVQA